MNGSKKNSPIKKKKSKRTSEHDYELLKIELKKKERQFLAAKAKYRRLAGEFIDLWVKVNKVKPNRLR